MSFLTRTGAALFASAVLLTAVQAAENPTPLDVRPGYWETTLTITRSGPPPLPAELLARMSPEQRKAIEDRLKSGAQTPMTRTIQTCITKEDLAKALTTLETNTACKRTVLASSAKSQDYKVDCANQLMSTTGTGHLEVIDAEHFTNKMKSTITASGQSSTSETTSTSKWISEACPTKKEP